MRQWYKEWYSTDVPAESHMMNVTDLNRLENAKPFDKEFIEQMVPHHQMAIMMARMVLYHSNRSEIRGLAESIIKSQSAEIEEMRTWYKEWYGTGCSDIFMRVFLSVIILNPTIFSHMAVILKSSY